MRRNRNLFSSPRQHRSHSRFAFPLVLLLMLCAVFGLNMINNGRISVRKESVTIVSLPDALDSFSVLHISDLHGHEFGPAQATIATMIKTAKFNAVCITGDVCAPSGDYAAFIQLLDLFPASTPVFFVAGDEDPSPILSTPTADNAVKADYILAAEAHGAIYLDAPYKLTIGKNTIWFCPESLYGLDIPAARETYLNRRKVLTADNSQYLPETAAQLRALDYRLSILEQAEQALREIKGGDTQIALTHHPLSESTITTLQQWAGGSTGDFLHGVSLVLAGHYNGGQIRLPVLGPIRAPRSASIEGSGWFPGDRGLVGLSTVQGISQYISPGLGVSSTSGLPIRLFNTPAVTVITLTNKLRF